MPDETQGPEPVSPQAEDAKASAKPAFSEKSDAQSLGSQEAAAPAPAVTPAASPENKSSEVPKSAAAEKPAASAAGVPAAKPAAPAAVKPAAPAKPEGPKPGPWDSDLVTALRQQYGSGIVEASIYLGQRYLIVDNSILAEILRRMRGEEGFDYCVDITAVHYPKREQQFDIVYVLYSFPHNERIRVKSRIHDGEHVQSAVPIWPTADWLEREVFDMFGIQFAGHPGLKRILLPEDWKGHPLRKDYDILQQDKEWVQINLGIESGQ